MNYVKESYELAKKHAEENFPLNPKILVCFFFLISTQSGIQLL